MIAQEEKTERNSPKSKKSRVRILADRQKSATRRIQPSPRKSS